MVNILEESMKRVFIFIAIILVAAGLSCEVPRVQFNLGLDFPGDHELEHGSEKADFDSEFGLSPSLELLVPVNKQFHFGPGVEYQIERGVELEGNGDYSPAFGFIPVYLTGKIGFIPEGPVIPELNIHLGYAFMHANDDYKGNWDLTGDIYFAIGGGILINQRLCIDMLYRYQQGSMERSFYSGHHSILVTQRQLTLQFSARI